jgi:hypothetical protein
MCFIKHSESYRGQPHPDGLEEAMGTFVTESMAKGIMIDTAGLTGSADASEVRLSGGRVTVTDGPFTESKEIVGGYALIDVKTRKEAMDLAVEFMEIHRIYWPEFEGACELRPLEVFETP